MAGGVLVERTPRAVGTPSRPSRRRRALGTLLVVVPFALAGLLRATSFAEGDTFWSAVAGGDVLDQGSVSLPDTFSWTVAGRVWHPNSWLYDVLLHLAAEPWGAGGLALVAVVTVLATGAGVAVAGRVLGARPVPLFVVGTAALVVLFPWLSARAQTVSYGLLLGSVALTALVVQWRGRRLVVGLLGLYLLSVLWVDLHLAALSSVPATAAGVAVLLVARRSQWRRVLVVGSAALGVTLLGCASSPLGWSVLSSAVATRDASTELITEWAPLWRAASAAQLTWLAAVAGFVATLAAWRRRPDDQVLPVWAGATAAMLLMGVSAVRFSAMALVLTLPAVAALVSDTDWTAVRWRRSAAFFVPPVAVAMAATCGGLALTRLPSLGEPADGMAGRAIVEAVPAGCHVLNEYNDGGWITYLRVDDGVLVAQDGRNDVYGKAVLEQVQGLIDGHAGTLGYLQDHGVGCLLLDPGRPVVAQARTAGWTELAADPHRVLLVAPVG